MSSFGRAVVGLAIAVLASACGSPAASQSPVLPANFPLGTWTNYVTEEDLRAAGYTDPATITENVGSGTLTLSPDSTWTIAVESDQPMRWPVFRGTYTVTSSNTFRMLTAFPPDLAGEIVDLEWSQHSDGLHLRTIDPYTPILRVQYETRPWQRKG